jgi:hypothetical protein
LLNQRLLIGFQSSEARNMVMGRPTPSPALKPEDLPVKWLAISANGIGGRRIVAMRTNIGAAKPGDASFLDADPNHEFHAAPGSCG